MLASPAAVAIEVANRQDLSFGRFVAGPGTVAVSATGARTVTGAVVALSSDPGRAAQFLITGEPGASYSISLPADGTVQLVGGGTALPVNRFTSSPASAGVLPGSGSEILNVGATLEVGGVVPAGPYSGSFTLLIEYN